MDTWLREFLEIDNRKDLKSAGKPFYKYKVTDQEYNNLKLLLKDYAERIRFGVGITTHENLFQIYLVLYSAEWWRRDYTGGHWKWEPIFDSFGINNADFISPTKRNQYIENGFKFWGLKLRKDGKRYLGTIAINGGLPISLITGSNRVSSLLDRLMVNARFDFNDRYLISDLIETDYKHYLPTPYRIGHIYDLIAEIISISIEITAKYELKNSKNPIYVLNRQNPVWREDFPISLNEKEGQLLIDSLIFSTTKKPDIDKTSFFDIKYVLEPHEDLNDYVLICEIEVNELIKEEHLKETFKIPDESLSPYYILVFDLGDNLEFEVDLNPVFGKKSYKPNILVEKRQITEWFRDGIFPHVYLRDRRGATYQLINKSIAELEPPIIVFTQLDSRIEYRFSGDGKLKEDNAIVWMTSQPETFNDFRPFGRLKIGANSFELLETRQNATITVENSDGLYAVNIKLNSQLDDDDELYIIGNQVNGLIKTSIPVYRGEPKFRKNGRSLTVDWFKSGSNTPVQNPLGYVTAKISSNNGYIKRKKMIVLPSQSNEVFKERIDSKNCIYELRNWGNDIRYSVDEYHNLEIVESGSNFQKIRIEKITFDHNDLDFKLNIRSNSFNRSLELNLPWFASSVICMDRFGAIIQTGSFLNVEELYGIRLFGSLKNRDKIVLLLEMDYAKPERWELHISDDGTFRLSLNDFKKEIKNAIENLKEVKSKYEELGSVKLTIYIRDRREFHLNFAPYFFNIIEENNKVKVISTNPVTSDEPQKPILKFIPASLDHEKQKDIEVKLNEWVQVESIMPYGTNNLVYCRTETGMYSPQIDLKLGKDVSLADFEEHSLLEISLTSNSDIRDSIINIVFDEMKEDLSSRWWIDLEDILSNFGHLRWRKVEIVKKFVNNPRLVAISLLNIESKHVRSFLLNLISQNPIPVMRISLLDWEKAHQLSYSQVNQLLTNSDSAEYLYMKKTMEVFRSNVVELFSLLPVLVKSNPTRYVQIAVDLDNTIFQFNNDNIGQIFERSSDSAYQRLLRKTYEYTNFPDYSVCELISKKIQSKESKLLTELVVQLEKSSHSALLAAPVLMAEYIYMNRTHELGSEFYSEVRKIQKYDPNWYNTVFKLTLSHFASNG